LLTSLPPLPPPLYPQLTDLGNFKPALLPADDPADFSFYFDGGGARRSCYLAPERFGERPLSSHPTASAGLQPSMDVFSAGCVLLELLLE
jgi:phosphoinositide-3-kinase regulatory subunit 4